MEKRRLFKKKEFLEDHEEDELHNLEEEIANKCEELNRNKVADHFKAVGGYDGNLSQQGIWK